MPMQYVATVKKARPGKHPNSHTVTRRENLLASLPTSSFILHRASSLRMWIVVRRAAALPHFVAPLSATVRRRLGCRTECLFFSFI